MNNFSKDKIDISKTGIGKFFGDLEAKVMEILWSKGKNTVQTIRENLDKEYSFNTIMTVMNRLVDKGLLNKDTSLKPYEYSTSVSKDSFYQQMTSKIFSNMGGEMSDYVLAHFADVLEVDAKDLKKLEEHLKKNK